MWTVDIPSREQIKIYITVFMGFDIVGYEPLYNPAMWDCCQLGALRL